jgi:hypothetical protein
MGSGASGALLLSSIQVAGPRVRLLDGQAEVAPRTADVLERAASEYVEDCLSVEDYRMLERAIGRPRYSSLEETDADGS